VRLALADPAFHVEAALASAEDAHIGTDIGTLAGAKPVGTHVTSECDGRPDVLIDFSTPAATAHWSRWCAKHGVALVTGTTGLSADERDALKSAADSVPVLAAPNMSVGVNLLIQLVSEVATRLGVGWDIEITESHHRHKVDAPSGTAAALYEAACAARNLSPADAARYGRHGAAGPRTDGEIGVHSLRLGGVVGDHTVDFATPEEIVSLRHQALSRDTFAGGALRASKWLVGKAPGRYTMQNVLGNTPS
jgi:4-hydroxy-tetrahydrodipicolinate reductase